MSGGAGTAVAVTFIWFGMVLAISFLEAPLKFRAPGVDLRIGLGIGRLVFRALNGVEALLALILIGALAAGEVSDDATVTAAIAPVVLVVQLVAVRPALTRRSNRVLAGEEVQRSHVHLVYIALEVVKVVALMTAGVLLLRS